MAGDWIKMRTNLRRHPKIVRMASALKADSNQTLSEARPDRLRVIGGLHAVWSLFDEHSADGVLWGYTPETVDDEIGWPGFSDQMIAMGWLEFDGSEGLTLRDFDTHNGTSAKRRAQESERKRLERAAEKNVENKTAGATEMSDKRPNTVGQSGGNLSASSADADADKLRTREEKRREEEEEKPPQPPEGGGGGGESVKGSRAGVVCRAIKAKGVSDVNPSNPTLQAYIAQGVPIEVFEAAAETCAKSNPPKGVNYLLGIVKRQLGEAAGISTGPAMPAKPWDDTRTSILAKAAELGLKWTDEHSLAADRETFPAFTARVRREIERHAQPA
jgi:hypothetical protein